MSLFAPADPSGQQNAAFMGALLQTQMAGAAQNSLGTGYTSGLDFLNTGYGAAKGDVNANFDPALAAINQGYGTARGDVTSNYQNAYDKLSGASAGYNPYIQSGNAANATLSGALGIGGPGASASAMNAFHGFASIPVEPGSGDRQCCQRSEPIWNAPGRQYLG